jgi:hypothetical protein
MTLIEHYLTNVTVTSTFLEPVASQSLYYSELVDQTNLDSSILVLS